MNYARCILRHQYSASFHIRIASSSLCSGLRIFLTGLRRLYTPSHLGRNQALLYSQYAG